MKKLIAKSFLVVVVTFLYVTATAQPTLVEKVVATPDGLTIPYEKWKLPNGLTILIHEDHSDPVATVMITYKVGSNRESVGKSGFAHLFEHMLFQGSKHVGDEQHERIINSGGGEMNGNTTEDRTQYYDNVPSNMVEVAMWLESDRMAFLLDSLTTKKFENQRDAVKNEKFQNQMNQPYGMVEELMGKTLYPFKHPYSWSVIGYVDDLDRANIQDVKNFFMRWYGPNNAILTIAGDVDPKQILQWAEKYFAPIASGPEVKKLRIPLVTLPADKSTSYRDKVYFPAMTRVFPTVPLYHRDEPALDYLADMMGGGNNSIFYKNFIKTEKAVQASVSHPTKELSGEFTIEIDMYPTDDVYTKGYTAYDAIFKEAEDLVKSTLDDFEKTGITDEALQRVKARREAALISGVEDTYSKARELTTWEHLAGKTFNLKDDIDRYNKVTKEDIVRVFNKYIKGAGAASVYVYPRISDKDSVKSINPNAGLELKDDPEYIGLKPNSPANEATWATQPAPAAPKTVNVPDFYRSTFSNGLKVIGSRTTETPTVGISIEIDGGNLVLSKDDLNKNGIAELTASVLREGSKKYTTEQLSAELDKLGSNIIFWGSKTQSNIYVRCLKKNLDATLNLLEEKLLNPRFDEADFKRVKKQLIGQLKQQKSSAEYIAATSFSNLLYGNTIWGTEPTKKTVDKITLDDVKNYYANYYSPTVARMVIVGDVEEKDIMPKLQFLNNWKAKDVKFSTTVTPAPIEPQVYVIDRPAAPSSVLLIGQTTAAYDGPLGESFKNNVANFCLGGGMLNSRLDLNLRENKGYTYGIYSGFNADKYKGEFGVFSSVKRKATGNSLMEVVKEMTNYVQNGITDKEVDFTKNSILNGQVRNYETNYNKLSFLSNILEYNLNKDYPTQQATLLKSMTKEDINNQIKKSYDLKRMTVLLVGDKFSIKKQLDGLNINMKDFNEKLNVKKFKELDVE